MLLSMQTDSFKMFVMSYTFCSFLNEDAFIFSESLTEKYCKDRLRNEQEQQQ